MAHHIRLAGPWEYLKTSDSEAIRSQLPAEIQAGNRLRRQFHRPTGLSVDSQLAVLISADHPILVSLNGRPLIEESEAEERVFDVSKVLNAFNTLEISSYDRAEIHAVRLRIVEASP